MPDSPNNTPPAADLSFEGFSPGVWVSANFAEFWYRDTLKEAAGNDGDHSTRREIVFAASFLESYIFEWVRSVCFNRLNDYFPPTPRFKADPRYRRNAEDKWKFVPVELHNDGVIAKAPTLDLSPLGTLMQRRNGLIHARASRPSTAGLPKEAKPVPEIDELKRISHGWAFNVAKTLVLQLHAQLGTKPPRYL
jgi:hypothetical protein